jgi:NTE family protein
MLARSLCLLLLASSVGPSVRGQAGDECRPLRTALVLSGGGATGLAHVGVIRVLDSLGIRPDLIVGSSMGSIVGAMYASGYSGSALDSIIRALPLEGLFGKAPALPHPLAEWPHQVAIRHGRGKVQPALPFVDEGALNLMLSAWLLEGNLQAAGNFDSLTIPLRIVATDLEHRQPMVLAGGDLALAVRASIAVPMLFLPIRVDGHWLGDGSLTANLPVAIARERGAERLIVSDATNHLADTLDLERLGNMGTLMLSMLLTQGADSLGPDDVLVRSEVSGIPKFDFSPAAKAKLIEQGVTAARAALPGMTCRSGGPSPARGRRAATHVRIASADREAARALRRPVRAAGPEPLDVNALRTALVDVASPRASVDALWLNPSGTDDSLWLSITTRPSDPWISALGLAYDADLGIRGWVGTVGRGVFSGAGALSLRAAAGRWRQEAEIGYRLAPQLALDMVPVLQLVGAHEDVRQFTETGLPLPPLDTWEFSGLLGVERDLGGEWMAWLGATYIRWSDSAAGSVAAPGLAARLMRSPAAHGPTGRADAAWNTEYARVTLHAAWPAALGRLLVTPGFRYGWGYGLPLQHQFPLGGSEGFPGLPIGEVRGDHEALVRLDLSYRLVGPLRVTAQGAGGLASMGGDALPRGSWRWGARLGLGLTTPFGPVRIEYGHSTGDRSALFLRVGRWF